MNLNAVLPEEISPNAIFLERIQVLLDQHPEFFEKCDDAFVEGRDAQFLADPNPDVAIARHRHGERYVAQNSHRIRHPVPNNSLYRMILESQARLRTGPEAPTYFVTKGGPVHTGTGIITEYPSESAAGRQGLV